MQYWGYTSTEDYLWFMWNSNWTEHGVFYLTILWSKKGRPGWLGAGGLQVCGRWQEAAHPFVTGSCLLCSEPSDLETTVSVLLPGWGGSWRVGHEARIKERKALSHIWVGTGTEEKAELLGQSRAPTASRQEIGAGVRGWEGWPKSICPDPPTTEGFSASGWSAEIDRGGACDLIQPHL